MIAKLLNLGAIPIIISITVRSLVRIQHSEVASNKYRQEVCDGQRRNAAKIYQVFLTPPTELSDASGLFDESLRIIYPRYQSTLDILCHIRIIAVYQSSKLRAAEHNRYVAPTETQAVGETPTITCECKKAELPENADMVQLVDTSDLGSDAHWACRFKSCCPYQSYCGYNDNNSTLLIIFEVRKAPDAPIGNLR